VSVDPLKSLGGWRAAEGAVEVTIPLLVVGTAWYQARGLFAAPTAARSLTPIELLVVLGACAALTGWMASRQMIQLRRRSPWSIVLLALVYVGGIMAFLPGWARDGFDAACKDTYQGEIIASSDLSRLDLVGRPDTGPVVCRIGGVPDNAYLPGALLRPSWYGALGAQHWAWVFGVAGISALGLRDRRLRPTSMVVNLLALLRYAPALGHQTSMGKPPAKDGKLVACSNATLWGEPCGQIYAAERVWQDGEWCGRCGKPFRRAEREVQLKVVTLFTADVDVLNGIEGTDTVGWERDAGSDRGDARPSGMERWVQVGAVSLPDVLTVAQTLSIIHDLLPIWGSNGGERIRDAAALATRKASRVSAWIWFGSMAARLTYARPTNRAVLAIGPTRLRDLISEGGEELWLQLDVGLLPLELRWGHRKPPSQEGGRPYIQDSKMDLWIPVAPPSPPKAQIGLWVPRIEGEALRTWISTKRLPHADLSGDDSYPIAYRPLRKSAPAGRSADEAAAPAPAVPELEPPRPGSLDFVRQPLDPEGEEPTGEQVVGASIAEWAWMEWEQIQLLRQQCLVLVERPRGRRRSSS